MDGVGESLLLGIRIFFKVRIILLKFFVVRGFGFIFVIFFF